MLSTKTCTLEVIDWLIDYLLYTLLIDWFIVDVQLYPACPPEHPRELANLLLPVGRGRLLLPPLRGRRRHDLGRRKVTKIYDFWFALKRRESLWDMLLYIMVHFLKTLYLISLMLRLLNINSWTKDNIFYSMQMGRRKVRDHFEISLHTFSAKELLF